MAWVDCEIVISDDTIKGSINRSDDSTRVEIPFIEGISTGDTISVDGKTLTIKDFTDIGGRNERLLMEIENDKSVQRGTRSKARKSDVQDEVDS